MWHENYYVKSLFTSHDNNDKYSYMNNGYKAC